MTTAEIEARVAGLLEQAVALERKQCAAAGHDWRRCVRGAPVTTFAVCRRCGKIGPRMEGGSRGRNAR